MSAISRLHISQISSSGLGLAMLLMLMPGLIPAWGEASFDYVSSAKCPNDAPNYYKDLERQLKSMPKDVVTFSERYEWCHHVAGEEPYDHKRAAFLNEAWKKSKCSQLNDDRIRLLHRYPHNKAVAKVMTMMPRTDSLCW